MNGGQSQLGGHRIYTTLHAPLLEAEPIVVYITNVNKEEVW